MKRSDKKHIDFRNAEVFEQLEDKATSGILNYAEFPPAEYKYFSQLTKLGYDNHHKGLDVEFCKAEHKKLKKQYNIDRENYERVLQEFKRQNELRIQNSEAMYALETATTEHDKLEAALTALEAILGEKGLKERIMIKSP